MTQLELRALAVQRSSKTFRMVLTRYNRERAAGRYYSVRRSAVDNWEATLISASRAAWRQALADTSTKETK